MLPLVAIVATSAESPTHSPHRRSLYFNNSDYTLKTTADKMPDPENIVVGPGAVVEVKVLGAIDGLDFDDFRSAGEWEQQFTVKLWFLTISSERLWLPRKVRLGTDDVFVWMHLEFGKETDTQKDRKVRIDKKSEKFRIPQPARLRFDGFVVDTPPMIASPRKNAVIDAKFGGPKLKRRADSEPWYRLEITVFPASTVVEP